MAGGSRIGNKVISVYVANWRRPENRDFLSKVFLYGVYTETNVEDVEM